MFGFVLVVRVVFEYIVGIGEFRVLVVDVNKLEKDIFLKKELDDFVQKLDGRLKVIYILSSLLDDWRGLKGYVNEEVLRNVFFFLGFDMVVFVCGLFMMMQKVVMLVLRGWGYKEDVDLFGF